MKLLLMKSKTIALFPHELAAIRQTSIAEIFSEIRSGKLPYSLNEDGTLIVRISYTFGDPCTS